MEETIAAHCDYTAFIFMPNICNAKCSFCYVRPAFSEAAYASESVRLRAEISAQALSDLGFRTMRFSGGEPTLFKNFSEIVRPFTDRDLAYRVLTNGIDIDHCLDFFREKPPERFTISVHTTSQPEKVFGVPISATKLRANRRILARIAEVEATIVVEEALEGWKKLNQTLTDLNADGIEHIKIILENSIQDSHGMSFRTQAGRVQDDWFGRFRTLRISDTHQQMCKLTEKGFPAIELGKGRIYSCCVQVGDRPVAEGYSDFLPVNPVEAALKIAQLIERSVFVRPGELPCESGISSCPLALT